MGKSEFKTWCSKCCNVVEPLVIKGEKFYICQKCDKQDYQALKMVVDYLN